MLFGLLTRLTGRGSRRAEKGRLEELLEQARTARTAGDPRTALKLLREYALHDPDNVPILNDIGSLLVDIGDLARATEAFELAYSLDDTFLPGIVNRAKVLTDQRRGAEAMQYLTRAKIVEPSYVFTDAIYAAVCMGHGELSRALAYELRAWLADFDGLRHANAYLFSIAYGTLTEEAVAAEHNFWAETLARPHAEPASAPGLTDLNRRVRIGYWSPDFRNHSVRFFSRPLLENHDRERFEVHALHDYPGHDAQTKAVEGAVEHFHDVHEMPDDKLAELMRSLDLDVLVELSGHTSYNRLSMLRGRFARLQVTGLGYPPTTGLKTIDAKILDTHSMTPHAARYYAERPMVLPTSFWCFDPMEDVPIGAEPPVVRNGFITFGCVGNISKISDDALASWSTILTALETSRLVIRSISFADDVAFEKTSERLRRSGLPLERIDLLKPADAASFWSTYEDIDIVLDTFPFNGGTTTCFATYMGVPVVSIAGESLVSRMGASILTNLGAGDMVVRDFDAYTKRAIALGNDIDDVRRFKHEARSRYQACALGNGAMFAREFEQACLAMLRDRSRRYENEIAPLPAGEMVRRAYRVIEYGNFAAARRIANYCMEKYPADSLAHVMLAQLEALEGQRGAGLARLEERVDGWSPPAQVAALMTLCRFKLLDGDRAGAQRSVDRLLGLQPDDVFDREQAQLYALALSRPAPPTTSRAPASGLRFRFIVPCNERARFDELRHAILECCVGAADEQVTFESCAEGLRHEAYAQALSDGAADVVVFVQKNVRPVAPNLMQSLEAAMEQADIVGFAGASRWTRLDWRFDDAGVKFGSVITPSSEQTEKLELQLLGTSRDVQRTGMAVLDGGLVAVRCGRFTAPAFDEELLGCDTQLEEYWVHEASRAGARLAARRDLGVVIDPAFTLDRSNRTEARVHCSETMAFDPFAPLKDDAFSLSVPLDSPAEALAVCAAWCE